MIQVSIIIPQGCVLYSSIERLCTVFDYANSLLEKGNEEPIFSVVLVSSAHEVNLYGNHYSVKPHYILSHHSFQADLVIVPALAGNIADALKNNRAFSPWIMAQYRSGAEIAGLCTGAFLMAATPLADEKNGSQSWYVSAGFRREFSQVALVAENIVRQEAISSGNGAYTFITKLLERSGDEELVKSCASLFEMEFNRECQSVFSIVQDEIQRERSDKKHRIKNPSAKTGYSSPSLSDRFYLTPNRTENVKVTEDWERNDAPNQLQNDHSNTATIKQLFRKVNVQ